MGISNRRTLTWVIFIGCSWLAGGSPASYVGRDAGVNALTAAPGLHSLSSTHSRRHTMGGPLEGIRVLDFTIAQQGAYATLLMADMGAEVTKVEEPGRGET